MVIDGIPTKNSFSNLHPYPVYGSGKGTRCSPFLLLEIEDIILTAMVDNEPALAFLAPDQKTFTTNTILAYVDDTTGDINHLGQCMHNEKDKPQLEVLSKNIMRCYETYLHMTGGK